MHTMKSLFLRQTHRFITIGMILCIGLILGGCPSPDLPFPSTIDPTQESLDPTTADEVELVLAYTGIYPLTDTRGWPSNLTVTRLADQQILLGWQDNSADEEGFRIERQASGEQWQSLGTVGRNQTSYIDESVEPDTSYSYRIIAFNTNDESTPSIAASLIFETEIQNLPLTLMPIIDLQINHVAESSIQLTWSDVNDREKGTLIERSDDMNGWGKLAVLGQDLNTYLDTDLQAAVTYCYRVTPFREKENASVSESVCLMLEEAADSTGASGGSAGSGGGGSPPPPRPPFQVVEDGQPVACILVPNEYYATRAVIAGQLRDYIQRSTNVQLPIIKTQNTSPVIHLGRSSYVDQLGLNLSDLGDQGFVLFGVDENNFVIAGQTDKGTEFGVYEFLERYLGVRWLMPGEFGTDVPSRNRLEVPAEEVRQTPAFFSRRLSGLNSQEQLAWAIQNRLYNDLPCNHNLYKLFPPSRYANSHPEFYPTINGQLYLPPNDSDQAWQPNFLAPGIVSEAVTNIISYFQENPDARSYSLGINDSSRFDDAIVAGSPGKNFLNYNDVSNTYYEFCNQVVERVLQVMPNKYFTCLAYLNVAEPPSGFRLHPNIIPFFPLDRMKWFSPGYSARGEEMTIRWSEAATNVGSYDYIYGAVYCMPRVYPHLMQEYLRLGHAEGSQRLAIAGASAFWGEGPKYYIALKLLWNPYQDVDALLNDWYDRCVGKEAASYLREYYAIWERFWTVTIPTTSWFQNSGVYLRYNNADYLASVNEADVIRSRQLLDDCVAHTKTHAQYARAELLRRAFGYYEATYEAYRPETIAQCETIANESAALAAVTALQNGPIANTRRFQLWSEFQTDEVLRPGSSISDKPELAGETWGVSLPWRLLDHAQASVHIKTALEDLQSTAPTVFASNIQNLLEYIDSPKTLCSIDSSFENDQEGQTPSYNVPWVTSPRGDSTHPQFKITSEVTPHTGAHSLKITGGRGYGASVYQTVSQTDFLPPGRYLAAMRFYTPAAVVQQGEDPPPTVRISVITYANYGQSNQVQQNYSTEMAISRAVGGWNTICWYGEIADTIGQYPVSRMWVMASARYLNDQIIYFDDIQLYKIPD